MHNWVSSSRSSKPAWWHLRPGALDNWEYFILSLSLSLGLSWPLTWGLLSARCTTGWQPPVPAQPVLWLWGGHKGPSPGAQVWRQAALPSKASSFYMKINQGRIRKVFTNTSDVLKAARTSVSFFKQRQLIKTMHVYPHAWTLSNTRLACKTMPHYFLLFSRGNGDSLKSLPWS